MGLGGQEEESQREEERRDTETEGRPQPLQAAWAVAGELGNWRLPGPPRDWTCREGQYVGSERMESRTEGNRSWEGTGNTRDHDSLGPFLPTRSVGTSRSGVEALNHTGGHDNLHCADEETGHRLMVDLPRLPEL